VEREVGPGLMGRRQLKFMKNCEMQLTGGRVLEFTAEPRRGVVCNPFRVEGLFGFSQGSPVGTGQLWAECHNPFRIEDPALPGGSAAADRRRSGGEISDAVECVPTVREEMRPSRCNVPHPRECKRVNRQKLPGSSRLARLVPRCPALSHLRFFLGIGGTTNCGVRSAECGMGAGGGRNG
jgi:hypothetical protein